MYSDSILSIIKFDKTNYCCYYCSYKRTVDCLDYFCALNQKITTFFSKLKM